MKRWPMVTFCLFALVTIVQFVPGAAAAVQYERSAVALGETWRLLSGHLAHWSFNHFAWDASVLLALGITCERLVGRTRTLATIGSSAVTISLVIWYAQRSLATYRGLSGIDSALFGLLFTTLAVEALNSGRRGMFVSVAAFAICFASKLLFETLAGKAIFVNATLPGFVPVPLAHAVGAAVGCVIGLMRRDRWFAHPRAAATIPAP